MAGGSNDPFTIDVSTRIRRLPPYLFARLNALKAQKRRAGADVIDLGMGNPIDPSPEFVIDKLAEAARDARNHRYSVSIGLYNLRREVALKYKRRYGVELDPDTEVVSTIGSKEGFSHLMLALLSAGDTVLVGDPAYPIHMYAVTLAGGSVMSVSLGNDEAFLARIEAVLKNLQPRPKLIIFNYPHNPSAITIEPEFWEKAVALAKKYGVLVISDFAYGETNFGGYKAPSFLATPGAKEVGVEFTTMSKPYNMAGWAAWVSAAVITKWSAPSPPSRAITTTATSPRSKSPASWLCAMVTPLWPSNARFTKNGAICWSKACERSAGTWKHPEPACSSGRKSPTGTWLNLA